MKTFMDMTEREQLLRVKGAVPSVEEFMEYRLGSSAVNVTLAINESVVLDVYALDSIELEPCS